MYTSQLANKQKGFTIVELLIVVVVIAILAAITIVSYTGITSRANAATAKGTASNLQKKVETYAADGTTGTYPATLALLSAPGNSWTTPAAIWTDGSTVNGTISASSASDVAQYLVCGRASSGTSPVTAPTNLAGIGVITGARIAYWNHTASTPQVNYMDSGIVNPSNTGNGTTVTVNAVVYNIACFAPTS